MKSFRYNAWMLALVIGCSWGCSSGDSHQPSSAAMSSSVVPVSVEVVFPVMREFSKEIRVIGSTESLQHVDILPMESGWVQEVLVSEGDYVEAGELLIRLENPLLQREAEALRIEAKVAEKAYNRLRKAAEGSEGLIPKVDLEKAESNQSRTAAELSAALDRISFLSIYAPFEGAVTQRNVHPGFVVENALTASGQKPLLRLVHTKTLRIRLPFPEREAKFVQAGDSVDLYMPDWDRHVSTVLSYVSAEVDEVSRTIDGLILWDQDAWSLRPGMYVEARIQGESSDPLVSLPHAARFERDGLPFVYSIEKGIVRRVPVRTLTEDKHHFAFTSPEVEIETPVIITGRNLVSLGDSVIYSIKP